MDGRLNILAADYPARRVVRAGDQPLAMADRQDFLIRIVRILSADAADGVMATMDVLEELLVLHDLMQARGLPAFLNEKLLIASLNRGGLSGSSWEMNDPPTGPTPTQCAEWRMDGVKMLWRFCESDQGSLSTLRHCAQAISEANSVQMPFFLEPLPVVPVDNGYKMNPSAEAFAQLVGAATALGDSSRYLWLMLRYCANFNVVAISTTLPILLLGGEAVSSDKYLSDIKDGLAAGHNVRGVMIGRSVLYAADQDPVDAAGIFHDLVHKGPSGGA
ncbi:MAG TPA: hypothetical protein V6D22_16270 [Candidatus Obscuribacterales bacterium]